MWFLFIYFMGTENISAQSTERSGLFLILLWSIRFVVEFVKESQGGFKQYPIFNAL